MFCGFKNKIGYGTIAISMNKKFTASAIFLLAILIIRMLMQIVVAMQGSIGGATEIAYLLFALLYLAAGIGIARKKRWGAVTAIIIGIIDLLSALALGGTSAIGAGAVDILILFLAYRQFKIARTPIVTTQL